MKIRSLYYVFCLILITSCGTGTDNPNNPIIPTAEDISSQSLFDQTPIKLSDAASYYSESCNKPSFQFLIPTLINDDIYTDFIAHFWCDTLTPAEFDDQPTQDVLVTYLSDSFGGYSINNIEIFGEIQPKLGGASRKYARGDLNDDGKEDFAFAMNWEDGRAAFDTESIITNYTRPSILMSNESGYEVVRIGKPDWGHSVQIKDNKVFFAGHSSQAFELNNSEWTEISDEYTDLSFASFIFFDDYIINSVRRNDSQGLELIRNNTVVHSLLTREKFKVNFESWNNNGTGNYSLLGVYSIRGENYFHGVTTEMCRQDDLIIAAINASKLKSGEINENGYYSETDTVPVVIFAFYEIYNEELIEKNIEIIGEEINHNFNFFDCIDVNNDDQNDIVAQVFSQDWNDQDNNKGVPEIYIRNMNAYFNLNTTDWPTYTIDIDSQGYLHDIDSSGTFDLIMFPLRVNTSGEIEIYTSNRNISD